MQQNVAQAVADDDAVLGGLLVAGRVPADLRRRLRLSLFLPERQNVAEALLSAPEPFDWQGVLRRVYGEDAPSWETRYTLAAAFPDTLPLYVRLLEMRARVGAKAAEPRAVEPEHLSSVLSSLGEALESGQPPKVVRTPFAGLNHLLCDGFEAGNLIYIGARPKVGKSSFALEIARQAGQDGEPTLIVSREMSALALGRRLVAQAGRISARNLRRGRLGDGERVLVRDACARLKGLPIWITEEATGIAEIERAVQGFEPRLGLLVVDYLQLVDGPADAESRRDEVEKVSKGLKALAMSAKLPVVCMSSLARFAGKEDREPVLADLKETGNLEHDADVVLLLHRRMNETEAKCIVAAQRDGPTGDVRFHFRRDYVHFEEAEDREEA